MDSTYSNSSAWLECSICYEVMKEPRTLNCGHTFCCGCLQKLIDRVGNLKCPLDNRMFSVVRGNAGELMRNYKLEEAIEAVEAASARDLYYKCNRHKDRDAKMICNKCDVAYCSDCELEHARHGSKRSAQYTVESEPHQQQLQNQKQANPAASRPRRIRPTATSKYRQNSSRNTNREQYPFTTCSGCHRDVYSTYFVCTVCRSFNYCESCMWTRLHVHSMQIVTPERAEFADTNDFDYETVANYNDYEDYGEYSYRSPVRYSQPSGGRRKFFLTMIYVSSAIFLVYTLSRSRQRTTSDTASTILSSTLKQLCEYAGFFMKL